MAQTRGFHEGLYGPLHYTLAKGPADSSQPPIVLLHMSPNSSRVFDTLIPRNVRLSESPSHGRSIHHYDKASRGARAYAQLARELVKKHPEMRR